MLEDITEFFKGQRAKQRVVETMLRYGMRVDHAGRIFAGPVEMAPAKFGRGLGIDRRVVIETAKEISKNKELFHIFYSLEPRAYIANAAKSMGHDCIVIQSDPTLSGVVAQVTHVLAENKVPMRQITADDPDLFPDPVLTIIVQGKLSGKIINQLRALPAAHSISIK